jgi:predicted nucleic acid-binding protein
MSSHSNNDESSVYWHEQRALLGRKVLFIDTGALISVFDPNDTRFADFFDSIIGETLVTSTYVISEAARRLVKDRHGTWVGPGGARKHRLVLHMLKVWLVEHEVVVLCVPVCVFNAAKVLFEKVHQSVGCDLNDAISSTIVRGLEQSRIVAQDSHFWKLELTVVP